MSASAHRPIVLKGKLKFKGDGGGKKSTERASVSSGINQTNTSSSSSSSINGSIHSKKRVAEIVDSGHTSTGKNSSASKVNTQITSALDEEDEFLTESQRKHRRRKLELESRDANSLVKSSYRERVEDFNNRLASLTEHNDIPRISAAGNG